MLHEGEAGAGRRPGEGGGARRFGRRIGVACLAMAAIAPLAVLAAFLRDAPPAASGFWLSVGIVVGPYLLSAILSLAALAASRRGGGWAVLLVAALLILAGHSAFLARNLVWTQ